MPSGGSDLRDVGQVHPPWSLLLPLRGRSASVQGDRLPVLANLVSGAHDREPWGVLAVRLVRSASVSQRHLGAKLSFCVYPMSHLNAP